MATPWVQTTLRMTPEEMEALERASQAQGVTKNAGMRRAVLEWIEAHDPEAKRDPKAPAKAGK